MTNLHGKIAVFATQPELAEGRHLLLSVRMPSPVLLEGAPKFKILLCRERLRAFLEAVQQVAYVCVW